MNMIMNTTEFIPLEQSSSENCSALEKPSVLPKFGSWDFLGILELGFHWYVLVVLVVLVLLGFALFTAQQNIYQLYKFGDEPKSYIWRCEYDRE